MNSHLELHALPHPSPEVRRFGFELTDPYLEQCWSALLGPSCVALLRRTALLWSDEVPARVQSADLARAIGLSSVSGRRFSHAIERIIGSGFGGWVDEDRALGVYTRMRPIDGRRLDGLPEWTKAAHERLLGEHLDRIAAALDRPEAIAQVSHISTRLDRLQKPSPTPADDTRGIAQ